ncbi:hypothetical protein R1sor_010540 [Riccia sorocarpa]|uniref:Reverse transcriptase domain-containing protein n=1 Tax=Riccia sorocarpa TaxID=122646 RepID=A0ABD3I1R3_9MARC
MGPHFTRQPSHGNRFDQSRLDRFYISGRGEWTYHIRTVDHQGARTLSDHVPIKLEVLLEASEAASRPRRSYFKMDCKTLMKTDILARARATWQEHPTWAKDKRKRWALALGRIRKLLMEELAEQCRRRCKITWLKEDEAPSKYFFARLRAKHAQEEMTALEVGSSQTIEDPEEILEEVFRFYRDLYKAEEETEEILESRRKVVGRIDRRISPEENTLLEETPSEELIITIVMEMPKEKSPDIDGVMIEILRIGWEFMREDCFLMVQGFWGKKKLVGKDSKGVIKLIPKNDRKQLLQNWRPITLLTTTYKIVAKILAIRLKSMLPGIINTQQTGFVAGRNIIDNILSLRLGQEWAHITGQDVIFVKLDFMKAYDRVAHGFLWDTLEAMGIGEETLLRIKGLIVGGSLEVHINGNFTEDIQIGRGVRQGCPLAPLLFAMTTQPFMRALREEEKDGNIRGLNIGEDNALLHQLFADDTRICITVEER